METIIIKISKCASKWGHLSVMWEDYISYSSRATKYTKNLQNSTSKIIFKIYKGSKQKHNARFSSTYTNRNRNDQYSHWKDVPPLLYQVMQIKTATNDHLTWKWLLILQETEPKLWREYGKKAACWWEWKWMQLLWKTIEIPPKVPFRKGDSPYDSVTLHL